MSMYHVGDIVRIRNDLNHEVGYYAETKDGDLVERPIVLKEMEAARGEEVRIVEVHNNMNTYTKYYCEPLRPTVKDIWKCFWVAGCFEPIEEDFDITDDWDSLAEYLFDK